MSKSADKTKERIPNKTQWALEDIVAACRDSSDHWQMAFDRAERQIDPALAVSLGRLRHDLARIERYAKDALNGEYHQNRIQV